MGTKEYLDWVEKHLKPASNKRVSKAEPKLLPSDALLESLPSYHHSSIVNRNRSVDKPFKCDFCDYSGFMLIFFF